MTRPAGVFTRRQLVAVGCGLASAAVFTRPALLRAKTEFKAAMTTLFWVGEPADADDAFIPNYRSYWDKEWQLNYGGVDDPNIRNGAWPAGFRPKENPFYVGLPFGEFTSELGYELKANTQQVPWYKAGLSPILKNHWVEIGFGERTCYAQWEDVGPLEVDDFAYVFGEAEIPLNSFDTGAGLDASPAVWRHLGLTENEVTVWRFVDAADVPPGPWTEVVSTSGNNRLT